MKAHFQANNNRCWVLFALFPISGGLSGCVSLSSDILKAPDNIRTNVHAITSSDEHQIRALTSIDAQHFDEFERLLIAYAEMCRNYRREAIRAARQRVLENFDDAAFRLINSGLDAELGANLPYQKLLAAELSARIALDQAIVTEKASPRDPNVRNVRLEREQEWQETLRVLISTQNGLRADLIVNLAQSRESFRASVDKAFDAVEADQTRIPSLPPYQSGTIANTMDDYLAKAEQDDSLIDQELVDLSGAMQFSTTLNPIKITSFVEGAGLEISKELGSSSLIAALAGDALKTKAPDIVSDVDAAETALNAQGQATVDKTAKDTGTAAAAKASAAPAAQPAAPATKSG